MATITPGGFRRAGRRMAAGTVAGALLFGVAGCGGGGEEDEDTTGMFVAAPVEAYPLPCLEHQPKTPSPAYTAEENPDTRAILTLLRYYTANKDVSAYCDGAPPTERDRAWARLYVDLGAEEANVDHLLS